MGLTRPADEKLSYALGLEGTVTFKGWLTREIMLEHLQSADIAVAPFLALEPFYFDPAKILDYMSTGIAIVASRLNRIAEMLREGDGGLLVPPGDVKALASSICRLANDQELRSHFRAGGSGYSNRRRLCLGYNRHEDQNALRRSFRKEAEFNPPEATLFHDLTNIY